MFVQTSAWSFPHGVFDKVIITRKTSYLGKQNTIYFNGRFIIDGCWSLKRDTISGTLPLLDNITTSRRKHCPRLNNKLSVWNFSQSCPSFTTWITLYCKITCSRILHRALEYFTYLSLIHKSVFFGNIVYKIDVIIFDVDCPRVGEVDVFSAFFVRGC